MFLVSDKDWFVEQVRDWIDWFNIWLDNPSEIAWKIDYILDLGFNHKEKIVLNWFEILNQEYDYEKNVNEVFNSLIF